MSSGEERFNAWIQSCATAPLKPGINHIPMRLQDLDGNNETCTIILLGSFPHAIAYDDGEFVEDSGDDRALFKRQLAKGCMQRLEFEKMGDGAWVAMLRLNASPYYYHDWNLIKMFKVIE